MIHLRLKNRHHQQHEREFKNWLETLGYNKFSVSYSPVRVREFLHWLEGEQISLQHTGEQTITHYFTYLSTRSNQRKGGALSNDYLNMHLTSLKQFSEYLQQTRQQGFVIQLNYYPSVNRQTILSRAEIEALYESTGADTALNLRDRAILALYYGCGLRRNEGIQLDKEDLLSSRRLLYVRKGKGNRERYIPLARHVQQDLEIYLEMGRPTFRSYDKNTAFLLSQKGRISGCCVMARIKRLKEKASIKTDFGLHTLRHSIATHLLLAGMKLEQVAGFLGHESLESTQKYTHIAAMYDEC